MINNNQTKVKKTKLNLPKTKAEKEEKQIKEFLDMSAPSVIKFYSDYYICGNVYRSVWAIRDYMTSTTEQAILRHIGEKSGVTLKIYTRHVSPNEERKILQNATSKNRMNTMAGGSLQDNIIAESNLQDVATLIATLHREKEPLLHCAVYIETSAITLEALKDLQSNVMAELTRSKISIDRLMLRQKEGFISVQPCGYNALGEQFERVLPASSTANLYPLNYSGKTDPKGFYLGNDKYGSNIIVDFSRRADDKTNSNILILGNSGQGKSFLMKLLLINLRESGKGILCLDPEHEYVEITQKLGGCFIDLMTGEYLINVLEPRLHSRADDDEIENIEKEKEAIKKTSLAQHISFLRDFFRCYKDFTDGEIDTIEIMLQKLYANFEITENSNFQSLEPSKFPILSDLYELIDKEHNDYTNETKSIYTNENLRNILLGLNSLCIGAESCFFNGHTNITSDKFVTFGVKGLLNASKNVKNAMLFNILAYMSGELLSKGNTVASIDELYLFLENVTMVTYIRNFMKRVRKKESAIILASQNIEDFNQPNIAELTKPLFSIPTYQFLFNGGNVQPKIYMDLLQLEESEYELIKHPQRGQCLFKCGSERYNLVVKAPKYKEALYGQAGGR